MEFAQVDSTVSCATVKFAKEIEMEFVRVNSSVAYAEVTQFAKHFTNVEFGKVEFARVVYASMEFTIQLTV